MADGPDPAPASSLNLTEAMGGPLGMAETALPAAVFAIVYAVGGTSVNTAAIAAVAVAVVLSLARLVRRQSPRHALSGLVGVAFAAFIAAKSGKAENFFLPGLLANAAYASAFLISIAVRRPLVGELISRMDGEGQGWREDPERFRTFARASWMWAGVFLLRLFVQLPLYLAGAVLALGVAKTAMGLPLFALALWLTWRMTRRAPAAATPA